MFKKASRIERLYKKLLDIDNKLVREIRKLENYGDDCPCENGSYCEVVEYYGHDDYPSVGRYCMKCGGNVMI